MNNQIKSRNYFFLTKTINKYHTEGNKNNKYIKAKGKMVILKITNLQLIIICHRKKFLAFYAQKSEPPDTVH